MIKLFASDLDGSFLNIDHQMDENQIDCLKRIQENDCLFAIATGRGQNGVTRMPELYEAGTYAILLNGAIIQDPSHNIIYKKPIDKEFIKHLYHDLSEFPFEYCTEHLIYTTASKDAWLERRRQNNRGWMTKRKGDFEKFMEAFRFDTPLDLLLEKSVYKINLSEPDEDKRRIIHSYLEQHTHSVVNAPSNPIYIELTDQSVNKASGVKMLGRLLGIDDNSIAVFGDGGNDVVMLEAFHHSYAPADAFKEALEAANYTTLSCEEYGVVKKINEILERAK